MGSTIFCIFWYRLLLPCVMKYTVKKDVTLAFSIVSDINKKYFQCIVEHYFYFMKLLLVLTNVKNMGGLSGSAGGMLYSVLLMVCVRHRMLNCLHFLLYFTMIVSLIADSSRDSKVLRKVGGRHGMVFGYVSPKSIHLPPLVPGMVARNTFDELAC